MATGDASGWLDDYRPIAVNITSLTALAKALRDEVDLNFEPHARKVLGMLDSGVNLPARPGVPEWGAVSDQYRDSRSQVVALFDRYRAATLLIATAADIIARRYRESDQFAKATVEDVRDAFAQASRKYGFDLGDQGVAGDGA